MLFVGCRLGVCDDVVCMFVCRRLPAEMLLVMMGTWTVVRLGYGECL